MKVVPASSDEASLIVPPCALAISYSKADAQKPGIGGPMAHCNLSKAAFLRGVGTGNSGKDEKFPP